MQNDEILVWLDLETTGLASDAKPLEFGSCVTNAALDVIEWGPQRLIAWPPPLVCEPIAHEMHEKSGLLDEWHMYAELDVHEVEDEVLTWLTGLGLEPQTVPITGSSVQFDRRILAHHMPELEDWFFYRHVDVSTIKELCRRWYPAVAEQKPVDRKLHRVRPDLEDSIGELRFYRDRIFLNGDAFYGAYKEELDKVTIRGDATAAHAVGEGLRAAKRAANRFGGSNQPELYSGQPAH